MISLKFVVSFLLSLYLFSMLIAFQMATTPKVLSESTESFSLFKGNLLPFSHLNSKPALEFRDPSLAYKILTLLDVYKPVDDSYFGGRTSFFRNYSYPLFGLRSDESYCEKNRANFVNHPESVFEEKNVILEFTKESLMRNIVLPPIGNDVQPNVGNEFSKVRNIKPIYDLKPNANIFFSPNPFYATKSIGQQFSCLAQESSHIPGASTLARKDLVAETAVKYMEQYKDRPQCLNYDKFFPHTMFLYNKEDCIQFFNILESAQYKQLKRDRSIIYIRKIGAGAHSGTGVQPVNDEEELTLKKTFNNGQLCGEVKTNFIIQHYVHNPLLLNGNKFDFRMYMLVASTNPLMAYYHDGFLRVSLAAYDVKSNDKKVFLTNLALSNDIYDDAKAGNLYKGMDEEGLKNAQQWNFDRLQAYLLENEVISDPDWLNNYLRPEFKKAMIHLVRQSAENLFENSSLYSLYGVDFMLDEDLNLWFIEANAGPAFKGYSRPMEKFIVKMLRDHFEIVHGLLKSRMKRVVEYVNELIDEGGIGKTQAGGIIIADLNQKRQEFQEVIKNKFEEEYEPSASNGFSKIVDAHYPGAKMYQGYISEECL